jgi:DNA-binding response OmpR family regulator
MRAILGATTDRFPTKLWNYPQLNSLYDADTIRLSIAMSKVLIVEDNVDLAAEVKTVLKANRMTVDCACTLKDARSYMGASSYDVLILDLNLPDGEGIDLLQSLREKGVSTPVLILTTRSSISDKVAGFQAGTDDYLAKPFHPKELLCRIEALLRRPQQVVGKTLVARDISLNTLTREVTKGDKEIRLTAKEFGLLEFLLRHPGEVFSLETLLERVWKTDSEVTTETVLAAILRLRKKIDSADKDSMIKNIFGLGYKLVDKEN